MRHPDDEAQHQQEEPQAGAESAVAEAQPSTSSEAAQAEADAGQADAPAFDPETHKFRPTSQYATIVIHVAMNSEDFDQSGHLSEALLKRIQECRDFETNGCCDEHREMHRKELAFLSNPDNLDVMAYGIHMHSTLATVATKLIENVRNAENLPALPAPDQPWALEWSEDGTRATVQLLPLDHSPLNRH